MPGYFISGISNAGELSFSIFNESLSISL
jgi:hypothetical protein